MEISKKKRLAAAFSIGSNIFLSVLKILAGVLSGSLSIISEAIHSLSDLFASFLTYFSVIKSSKPADADHPYGHGKYEDMSGFVEGLLIILASFYIVFEASKKIINGISYTGENTLGIIVMLIAVIMNIFVSSLLFKVAKESDSISLYADGEHLRTDIYSSAGVLVGLLFIKITGYTIFDPVIAILVAAFIFKTGYCISAKALKNLLDHSLPDDDIDCIKKIIKDYSGIKLKRNSIKARQVGPAKDIDLILQFPEDTPICKCHQICDDIEIRIRQLYPNSSISIHSEPICYKKNCQKHCEKNCNNQ